MVMGTGYGTGIAEGMEGIATPGIKNIVATVHNDYTIAGSDSKARKRTMFEMECVLNSLP